MHRERDTHTHTGTEINSERVINRQKIVWHTKQKDKQADRRTYTHTCGQKILSGTSN